MIDFVKGIMKWMSVTQIAFSILSLCLAPLQAAEDWRMEFLKAEKQKTDTESLKKLHQSYQSSPEELQKNIALLGADKLSVRVSAQENILRMGKDVLPQLQQMTPPADAEARVRFRHIQDRLMLHQSWDSPQLVQMAAAGLLFERENPGKSHPSRKMFVEFFRQPADSLQKGYRRLRWLSTGDLDGRVAEQTLRFTGKRRIVEGDQRLYVSAQEATGEKLFPDRFRIDVKIGGMAGGEGTYHVGVAVGQVRALFHPGHETGALRFEEVGTRRELTSNADMGFTPEAGELLDMRIDVERIAQGRVKLSVTVSSADKVYRTTQVFQESDIGKLDQVSLDRSGREGGDGLFRNLVMQFALP